MPIKKIKAQSPDPYVGKIAGDTEFARLAHLNNLVDQINAQASPPPTPSTNIYNSDGTLTGNRILNGNNNFAIIFNDLTTINLLTLNNVAGLAIDGNNAETYLSSNNYLQLFTSNLNLTFDNFNDLIKSMYQGNDIGLKLDFANGIYILGENQFTNGTNIKIDASQFDIEFTTLNGIMAKFNAGNKLYQIGDITGTNNEIIFNIDDNNQIIKTTNQNNDIGLKLDFANKLYKLGQIIGGNTKTFTINDAAAFGFQFSGTGITQATTGAASGQYLKVNVGGTDYVIELKNPS